MQVESRGSDTHPSTSNMISLEFSKDSPHGSLGPGSVDDDEYVEYSFDMLADFPNNVEEEERVNSNAFILSYPLFTWCLLLILPKLLDVDGGNI